MPPTPSHMANHIDPAYNAMTKIGLTKGRKTNLLEYTVGISGHKKLIHTMPLKADQPTTRATVAARAITTTTNYLKSHALPKSNPLFSKNRATMLNFSTCFDAATLRMS